jgi:hypothetical protein
MAVQALSYTLTAAMTCLPRSTAQQLTGFRAWERHRQMKAYGEANILHHQLSHIGENREHIRVDDVVAVVDVQVPHGTKKQRNAPQLVCRKGTPCPILWIVIQTPFKKVVHHNISHERCDARGMKFKKVQQRMDSVGSHSHL